MKNTANNNITLNNFNNDKEKNIEEVDELILSDNSSCGLIIFYTIITIFSFFMIIPIYFLWCQEPYKQSLFFDGINKVLVLLNIGICDCCSCSRHASKTYELSQIQKVRIYKTSMPDPKFGFKKIYYINGDIYSLENQKESLFTKIDYSKERFDEFINFFRKHFNTEVITEDIPMEVGIDTNNDGNNNAFPLLDQGIQIPIKPSIDESAAKTIYS